MYEALREFLEKKQKELENLRAELIGAGGELERVKREKEEVAGEIRELVQAREKVSGEVAKRTKELDYIRAAVRDLESKGWTVELLEQALETAEKHRQTKKDLFKLEKLRSSLEREIQALETQKREMEDMLISEKNSFDQLQTRVASFRKAVAAVASLFSRGYSTEHVRSLIQGLETLGVKDDPLLSVTRLVTGLKKQRTILVLEEKIAEKRKELDALNKALADAKIELKVTKQLVKAFKEVENAGKKAISETSEQINNAIEGTASRFDTHVTESLAKFDAHIQRIVATLVAESRRLGELGQAQEKIQEILGPVMALLGPLESTECLKKVPLSFLVRLFDRLVLWAQNNLEDFSVTPSERIHEKQYNLYTVQTYKISALIELVGEGLRQAMTRQSKEAQIF